MLNSSTLANDLEGAYGKRSVPAVTGQKKAKAFSQFIDQGQTAQKGVPVSAPGIAGLASEYANTWEKRLPADVSAKKEAIAEHNLIVATTTSGGKHGVGGFMSGSPASYAQDLAKLFKKRLPTQLMAVKEAKLKDQYVKSLTFQGSGVAPDFVPDISPLS